MVEKDIQEIMQNVRDKMQLNHEAQEDVLTDMELLCEKYTNQLFHNSKADTIELAHIYIDFLEYARRENISQNDIECIKKTIQKYFDIVIFEYLAKNGMEYAGTYGQDVELKIASLFLEKRESIVSKFFDNGILRDVLMLAQNSSNNVANFLMATANISKNSDNLALIKDPIQRSKEIAINFIEFVSGQFRLTNGEVLAARKAVKAYLDNSGLAQSESVTIITSELFKMHNQWNPIIKRKQYDIGDNKTVSFGLTGRFPEGHYNNYILYLLPHLKTLPPELKELVGNIEFYDVNNSFDLYWESEYKTPNFYSCATSDYTNKVINIFSRNYPGDTRI